MKINRIGKTPNFGMQLTGELERGFERTKNEIKDFYGDKSKKYLEYCNHLNMVKEYSNNYVVGIGCCNDVYDPYYFKMRHKDDDKEYSAGCLSVCEKDELFTPDSLKNLAITAIIQDWTDKEALKENQIPQKISFFKKIKTLISDYKAKRFNSMVQREINRTTGKTTDNPDFYNSDFLPNGNTAV